ncbi:hypothetical protein OSSY52_04810 [Tepiditoga spiralis]|uniref:Putative regulatory protein FmdB zinc ribbon domain-containing protein n=1 Tax=Tepiditoga spiralis TaxID=2108365 RepID=A0A7G1G211_9BACT|nr:FmdB family zinc ribbon protein [Tepiditoga spiralis]BBE30340.1 hypothetical protein OSSY52_04810 [Tepiditoga spiralis]
MPIYRYECTECGHDFTVMHSMNETPNIKCEKCGAPAKRIIGKVGISFKGSGYYINDSKKTASTK